jgi:hydrogenase maturation protease
MSETEKIRLPISEGLALPEAEELRAHGTDTLRSILIAGVGNAWLRDDGFGSEVARRLHERKLPPDVAVMDAGTGGLDLAYEVMRGYDALVIVDVSQQGGAPGTLYVMEPDEESVPGAIEDGDVINPHGMDPQTVLRFLKAAGAWPGRVVVVACEPAEIEEMGWGLSDPVRSAVDRAVNAVLETVAELRSGRLAATEG